MFFNSAELLLQADWQAGFRPFVDHLVAALRERIKDLEHETRRDQNFWNLIS